MARLFVKGPFLAQAEIITDPETGVHEVHCSCGDQWTERGSLDDALNAADNHVDRNCPKRGLSWAADERANP